MIEIPIMEEDSYEKNVVMYVVIGEPKHIAGNGLFYYLPNWVLANVLSAAEDIKRPRVSLDYYF